jgi:hypothetical protein
MWQMDSYLQMLISVSELNVLQWMPPWNLHQEINIAMGLESNAPWNPLE